MEYAIDKRCNDASFKLGNAPSSIPNAQLNAVTPFAIFLDWGTPKDENCRADSSADNFRLRPRPFPDSD